MASWSQLGQLGPHITTLTLRGISKTHNRGSILQLLDDAGGEKKYNFVYMPAGRSTHAGLAIVNFVDAEACHRCFLALKNMQEQGLVMGIKSIGQSKIQGFSENLAYYVVISRQDERVTDQPLIFGGLGLGQAMMEDILHHQKVNGEAADQRFLEYLIKTFVTRAMKQRAEEQAEAMYRPGRWDHQHLGCRPAAHYNQGAFRETRMAPHPKPTRPSPSRSLSDPALREALGQGCSRCRRGCRCRRFRWLYSRGFRSTTSAQRSKHFAIDSAARPVME